MVAQLLEGNLRLYRIAGKEGERAQLLQVGIALFSLGQHHHIVRWQIHSFAGQAKLAAYNRLYARFGTILGKFQRTEHIGGVGNRHRRHVLRRRQGGQLVGLDCAFRE